VTAILGLLTPPVPFFRPVYVIIVNIITVRRKRKNEKI